MMHPYRERFVPDVISGGQRLRGVPGVDEQEGGPVFLDHLPAAPHARRQLRVALQRSRQVSVLVGNLRILHGQPHLLGDLGLDDGDLALGSAQEIRHLLDASHGGRQSDPLEIPGQKDQAFHGDG